MRFAFALLVVVVATPAFAGDGQVRNSTLRRLGLGRMEVLSDAQGMEVRGMSAGTMSGGMSLVFGILQDPANPGNFVGATDLNTVMASAENAGLQVLTTSQHTQGSAIGAALNVAPPGFAGAFQAFGGNAALPGFAGFSIGTAQ